MRTSDVVSQLLEKVCSVREQAATGRSVFRGSVHFWRGQGLVAAAFPAQHQRDLMLDFAMVGATGFSADLVAIAMDAYTTSEVNNPYTGEEWGPGEMEDLAKNHHGLDRGWVHDTLMIIAVNRVGDQWLVQRRYREKFRRITWHEPEVFATIEGEGTSAGGVVADALYEIMVKSPSLDQIIGHEGVTPQQLGLSEEAGRAHMDCATVKMMAQREMDGACLLHAEPGSERAKVIERSMSEYLA